MRRIVIVSLAALLAGACDDRTRIFDPELQPSADLVGDACTGVTGGMYTDCAALVALYDATNGPGWTANTDWLTPGQHCSWHGITCSADALPRVTEVELVWNNLIGPLPGQISDLDALEVLDLGGNQLTGPIPDL
ncbi:MAG: hypothetical protein PVH00_10530, partial [Gemmatimonadota bacterium]